MLEVRSIGYQEANAAVGVAVTECTRRASAAVIAAAVSVVPMAIYGIQDALDLWKYAQGDPGTYHNFYPYVNGSWLYMEIGTVLAADVELEPGAAGTMLYPTGLAAPAMALLSVLRAGDEVLVSDNSYDPSRSIAVRTRR